MKSFVKNRAVLFTRILASGRVFICILSCLLGVSVYAQDTVFRYADGATESNASGTDINTVQKADGAALGDVLKLSGTASQNSGLDIRGAYLNFTIQSDTPGTIRTIKKTAGSGRFYNYNEASGNASITLKDLSIQGSDSVITNAIGLFYHSTTPGATVDLTIDNVSFSSFKNGNYKGGVISMEKDGNVLNISSTNSLVFDSNLTNAAYGGAIAMDNTGTLTITGDTIEFNNNYAKTYGGAIHGANTTITGKVIEFTDNTANEEYGGALNIYSGMLTVTGTGENPTIKFSGNTAGKVGGAIRGKSAFSNGAFTFSNNTAGTDGGAIYSETGVTFSGDNTSAVFTGNTASGTGNDLYINGASGLSFTGSGTYSFDGGIYLNNTGATTVIDQAQVTIAGRADDTTNNYQLWNVTISNGGKLTANMDQINSLAGTFNLGTTGSEGALELNVTEGTQTFANVISGAGGLTKTGAGTLELTAANTFTGKTTVSGGTLKLSGSGKLASSTIDVASGTTLLYDNTVPHNTAPLTINVTGGTLEFYNTTVTDTHTANNGICSGVAGQDVTINGTGATLLIDGGGTVSAIAGSGKSTVTFALDSNSVFHVQNGYFINGGYATQDWTNNQAELRIGANGKVECWDGAKMQFGGLSGEAGAQLVNIKSGKGMSIGNGVTANQSYTYNGIISLNGKNIDFNGAGKQTLNGDITAVNMYNKAGTLILGTAGNDLKINSGVLIKADGGAVQVDGNLIVESGTFYPGGTWSTGTGTVTVKSGAVMRVGGTFGPTIGVKLDGGQLFNDGDHDGKTATVSSPITVLSASELKCGWEGSLNLTGGISGSGNLTVVNDSGITYFKGTGSDNYTGSLTIIGNVRIGDTNTSAVDAATYIGKGEIILQSASTTQGVFMNNDCHLTFANNLKLAGDSYLQTGWSKNMTFTGNITGSGRFEVLNDSGWIIVGTKCTDGSFTGDVQTDYKDSTHYGQLRLAADQPFGANAGTAYIYGKLDMNGFSQTFKGLSNDGDKQPVFNNSTTLSTLTLDTTDKDLTFKSSINGNIALVIKGTGTQTLSKAVEYTGSTTIESGTLALTATSGTNKLYNLSGAGNLDYGSSPLELFNTADTEFSGKLSGSGKLTFQNGSGWIELGQTADETFTGNVQINYANSNSQGRVRLGADNALGTANRAFIYGTIDMNGYDQSFAGLSNDGNKGQIFNDTDTLSTLTIDNISEDLKFQSSISGNVALVLTGTENGKLTLAKAPEYTGSTTVQAGTLALSQGGTLYNLSGGSADSVAAIDSTGKNLELVNTENTKFIGSIAAAAITKTGEGTLKVNGAITVSSLTVTGGEFDLLGSSTGGLTISNAVFSPGNSVGSAEVGGDFTLTNGASVVMEIGGKTPDKNDSLVASGELQLNDGKIYLTFADACELQPGEQFTAVFSGSNSASIKDNFISDHVVSYYFTDLAYVPYGDGYAITGIADSNALPEPSAWLLLLLGTFGLMYWRKK